jgi:hypothetical protein
MDPDKSCFVRCSSTEMYREDSTTEMYENRNNNQKGTPLEELYLFVELTTTVRVIPNNSRGKRRNDRGREDSSPVRGVRGRAFSKGNDNLSQSLNGTLNKNRTDNQAQSGGSLLSRFTDMTKSATFLRKSAIDSIKEVYIYKHIYVKMYTYVFILILKYIYPIHMFIYAFMYTFSFIYTYI